MTYTPPTMNQQRAAYIYSQLENALTEARKGMSKALSSKEVLVWDDLIKAIIEAEARAGICMKED